MSESYILSYAPPRSDDDEKKLIAYINGSKYVEDWTHPFVGMFIFKSSFGQEEISSGMDDFLTQVSPMYMLIQASGKMFDGRLSESSWAWFDNQAELRQISKDN